jgi:phosphatidylglycerophosphate synthase
MAVAILGREFFVNDLRAWIESRGVDFGAKAPGKIKMILQRVTAGVLLGRLADGTLLGVEVPRAVDHGLGVGDARRHHRIGRVVRRAGDDARARAGD